MSQKQSMLHEILAVEADAQGVAKRILPETIHTFKEKAAHFSGSVRTLKLVEDNGEATKQAEAVEAQHVEMVTTVNAKLQYTLEQVARYWDVVFQKDLANQDATADLVVDGVILATSVPATFLLGMEQKMKDLRAVYEMIPTLAPGIQWELAPQHGANVFRQTHPEVRAKTTKAFKHTVLVDATDKFPAQIEKWEENVLSGTYTKDTWSSCMTTTEKSLLIGRIDKLIAGAKEARMRANATPVPNRKISQVLVSYLHPNGF